MKLSVVLPSIHKHSLQRMLRNIHGTVSGDCEIIVVAPSYDFVSDSPVDVCFFEERVRLGSSGAQSYGAQFATGDFVVALSDDVELITTGWDEIALENFMRRERHGGAGPFCLDMRLDSGGVNAIFGKTYATLPMMRHVDADKFWYDPVYFSRHGDADLALRIWEAGGRVEWSEKPIVCVHPDNASNGMSLRAEDSIMFVNRWWPKHPGWPSDPSYYDCGIRMDLIDKFEGNCVCIPDFEKYHEARKLAGH